MIPIGRSLVGDGRPPLIVAELSGNHHGSLSEALEIVGAAAQSGAHAIKLQTYTPATLTIDSQRPEFTIDDPGSPWHGRRLWELYEEAHTPWEWHTPIFDAARALGLACISTAYDLSSLEFLLKIGVDAIKVASFELVHLPLLAAAAHSGKPLIVATGMASLSEIEAAVGTVRENGGEHLVLLQCTSAYPATERDANILTMSDLRARFACETGLSDHTLSPYSAFAATALGASVIEKHVTISRARGGVDASFSIEPNELRELVDGCARVAESMGKVVYGSLPSESASLLERPSMYVVKDVHAGDAFSADNVRIIRPSSGLAPRFYEQVLGRSAATDVRGGTPLSWDHVSGGPA